jgi:hypothetical protein
MYRWQVTLVVLAVVNDVVRPEAPPVDSVLVVGLTFVVTRVLLGSRVDLHL